MLKRPQDEFNIPQQQSKKTKNNPTVITLDISNIYSWSREEILFLLNAPIYQHGANLPWDKIALVKTIAEFDLNSVIINLQNSTFMNAVNVLFESIRNSISMCQAIVSWVNREFCTTWKNKDFIRELKKALTLQEDDIKMFACEDYNHNWIQDLFNGAVGLKWPPDVKPHVRKSVEDWLNSLRYFTIEVNEHLPETISGSPFSDRIEKANETFGVFKKAIWGSRAPPFVNRNNSIIETIKCLDTFIVDPSSKPIYPIISTSMGMGKTTFLLSAAKTFLQDPLLIYEYLFENQSAVELSWDMLIELISKEKINCPKVEFVNRLYRAIYNGHFIAIEPVTAIRDDDPSKLLDEGISSYMEKMFVGAILRNEEAANPTRVDSLQQLFKDDSSIVGRLKKFSNLIKWNAPKYYQTLLPTNRDTANDELPLLLFIDSFHLMNFDTSKKGSLYNTCALVTDWKNEIHGLSLILSTNSLPNQFISEEKTLFSFKSINLELLIGTDIFREIIYDIYGVFLNMSVLEECSGEVSELPEKNQLSPYLTRVIISLLYMCSGNGRAIERLYFNCNKSIQPLIEKELSMSYSDRMKLTHSDNYNLIWQDCKNVVKEFARFYPEKFSTNNSALLALTKIMGLNVKPDYLIDETPIEDLQKIGLFVKFGVDDKNGKCKYGGSFMMLHNQGIVNELKPITPDKSRNYTHLDIESEWLLQPSYCITTLSSKKQGDYFELTIASSIWARYYIACLENNLRIGSSIALSKVLPSCMIPSIYNEATISLKGVVKLCSQFQSNSATSILPNFRVIINLEESIFSDVILPIKVGKDTKFIGLQTKYLKEGASQQTWSFIDNAKSVLSFDNFAYVVVCPIVSKTLASFDNTNNENLKELVDYKERVKFASCEDLVSVWWYELMYKQNPHKRK